MPDPRSEAPAAPTAASDADAPYLVESYQYGTDAGAKDQLPTYTYSTASTGERPIGQPRSWDEAARAKATPIQGRFAQDSGHIYIDVDAEAHDRSTLPSHGVAPINTTITGYATALGWDLSKLCVFPYIFPPFTSMVVLVWETQNVRAWLTTGSGAIPRLSIGAGQRVRDRHNLCTARHFGMDHAGVASCADIARDLVVLWVHCASVCHGTGA